MSARYVLAVFLFVILTGCGSEKPQAPAIGQAYVGPATLNVRQEIALRSPAVAVVHHGERLEIIQRRRRFLKVRTATGAEGWTDERLLLTAEEVRRLKGLSEAAKKLPSQGSATSYDTLNVHTEPDRQSPSFFQIKPNEKFDVIAHELSPRAGSTRKAIVAIRSSAAKRPKRKGKQPRIPPPSAPEAPKPPADWLDLSKTDAVEGEVKEDAGPAPMDDWSLVRAAGGQTGWVLTSRLFMGIPDDVAQYAERRRITSYFSLGTVQDDSELKHHWLWTTIEHGLEPYDFDSFRVFVWVMRKTRHRYETAYIQRRMKGYFPVLLHPVKYAIGRGEPLTYPGFSVCLENNDGHFYRRNYAFLGNIVRPAGGETPCAPMEKFAVMRAGETRIATAAEPESMNAPPGSAYSRFKDRLGTWRKRWLGR